MSRDGTRFDEQIQSLRKEISAFKDHNNRLYVRNEELMKENDELRKLLLKSSPQAPATQEYRGSIEDGGD
jgi:regulator of replication initiation timing